MQYIQTLNKEFLCLPVCIIQKLVSNNTFSTFFLTFNGIKDSNDLKNINMSTFETKIIFATLITQIIPRIHKDNLFDLCNLYAKIRSQGNTTLTDPKEITNKKKYFLSNISKLLNKLPPRTSPNNTIPINSEIHTFLLVASTNTAYCIDVIIFAEIHNKLNQLNILIEVILLTIMEYYLIDITNDFANHFTYNLDDVFFIRNKNVYLNDNYINDFLGITDDIAINDMEKEQEVLDQETEYKRKEREELEEREYQEYYAHFSESDDSEEYDEITGRNSNDYDDYNDDYYDDYDQENLRYCCDHCNYSSTHCICLGSE